MENQTKIIEAIAEHLTLPLADIDMEADLKDDMGLNPAEVADLLEHLSRTFNIIFDGSDILQIHTVGELVEMVEDKLLE
ncbi:hypothetical protein A2617_00570 [Candidatus Daviesbacteria bacterium RIFOXYD1_FULL_41_10]|uniref:Carrier domain-containing protein n=2 Tax=Candidatus Daviesiibacteriota TaxID=1752718 RepID=A0A1F5N2K2_9BACT|nr:MAG: hypothetical protein UU67_C0023G0004 [Candidatus Daviesbacteria bacterium GW2011_GWB1_41_5]OGE71871.1 MAG: hypothetical protein A2617_00570 [Candidatus Daviesbacteria bacterium RIFOXYD1_FULL_41_10]